MRRLDLSIGENDLFVFEMRLHLMSSHLNKRGSLAEESILFLLQEARMRYLAEEGMTEKELVDNVGFMISQATLNYRAEAGYNDELSIQIYASRFAQKSRLFSFHYQIIRVSDNAVIVDAATQHEFYNYQTKRMACAPSKFYWMIHRNLQLITIAA
jgi:acyl-CoA thioesterase FadM